MEQNLLSEKVFFRFSKVFFQILVYKEDRTQILRPRKNIIYTILHVTSFCSVNDVNSCRIQKSRLKYAIEMY